MSTPTSGLESGEDLDNIPLVRLADVQPSRVSTYVEDSTVAEEINTANFEYVETDNTNEDSNGGSISVHSDVAGTEDDDSDSGEVIVPEYVPDELPIDIPATQPAQEPKANQPGSWPTLEILPGGVIKHSEKDEEDEGGDMMYACAKCPERFKLLFSLVKHVRWHEEERKRQQGDDLTKLSRLEKELISIKRARFDAEKKYKKQKAEVMSRVQVAQKTRQMPVQQQKETSIESDKEKAMISTYSSIEYEVLVVFKSLKKHVKCRYSSKKKLPSKVTKKKR